MIQTPSEFRARKNASRAHLRHTHPKLPDVRLRAPETAPVYIKPWELLKLRIFIDKSIVEVFVNGRQCVALRVYPGRADSLGVSLLAQGQDAVLEKLDAWQMKNIYPPKEDVTDK